MWVMQTVCTRNDDGFVQVIALRGGRGTGHEGSSQGH